MKETRGNNQPQIRQMMSNLDSSFDCSFDLQLSSTILLPVTFSGSSPILLLLKTKVLC